MSSSQAQSFDWPFGLSPRDIKTSVVFWGVFSLVPILYCITYKTVNSAPLNLASTVIWTLWDWGIWLLILPFVFKFLSAFENLDTKRLTRQFQLIFLVLLVALSYRVAVDIIGCHRGLAKSLLRFIPNYTAGLAIIIASWYLILRNNPNTNARSSCSSPPVLADVSDKFAHALEAANTQIQAEQDYPDTLLVYKGSSECLIKVDQIQCIKAAGNYVEIYCNDQPYLTRTTMKQIEQRLSPSLFLRTHRSHIININEIQRIKSLASDNASVELRSGMSLSIGKKYKNRIREHRI
ncbi:Response regulator of the LytR/AlgR family [Alteromonadaceae bacterium Bs31]|nr:Response regulator of the LytR/AlgR family [Alteromonadaceae bacterium Bs31]